MYLSLVVANHPYCEKDYLFSAPAWCGLKSGDDVIVDTANGEMPARVKSVCTVEKGSDAYWTIIELAHVTDGLKRVLKKVEYAEINYMEDVEYESL